MMHVEDQEKFKSLLSLDNAIDFMSSEESDGEHYQPGPRPRRVIRLPWERTKLRNMKVIVDDGYAQGLTSRQKRTLAPIKVSNNQSSRLMPSNSPKWAARAPTR